MFAYCTEALHLSEAEAYLRIAAARASREHPVVLTMLGDGRLHLSGIALLAPYLTRENRETLLRRATHRSKRQIEELIAEVAPREDVPALMRKLPERTTSPAAMPSTLSGMGISVTPSPVRLLEGPQALASVSIAPEHPPIPISSGPASRIPTPHRPRATSPPPCAERCASGTGTDAATSTGRGGGARSGTVSSTTTFTLSAWVETTAPRASA